LRRRLRNVNRKSRRNDSIRETIRDCDSEFVPFKNDVCLIVASLQNKIRVPGCFGSVSGFVQYVLSERIALSAKH
jgi:hypothetical protein